MKKAIEKLEPFFTAPNEFNDVSRGKPVPHSLPEDKRKEVGLTRDTWKLEIVSDPATVEQWKEEARNLRTYVSVGEPPVAFQNEAEAERAQEGEDVRYDCLLY